MVKVDSHEELEVTTCESNESPGKRAQPQASRRALFALGLPAAAVTLTACGKNVFGKSKRKLTEPELTEPEPQPSGVNGSGNQTPGGGNPPNGGNGANGGSGADSLNPALDPCVAGGLNKIVLNDIPDDDEVVAKIPDAAPEGFRIYGHRKSALLALKLRSNLAIGTQVLVAVQAESENEDVSVASVLASQTVLNQTVDLDDEVGMIVFDNLDVMGGSSLILIVIEPEKAPVKTRIANAFVANSVSGRFGAEFKDAPVYDALVGFLPEEGSTLPASDFRTYGSSWEMNAAAGLSLSFARGTTSTLPQGFRAINAVTDGYLSSTESDGVVIDDTAAMGHIETAHIAHRRTQWFCPENWNLSNQNIEITDLLGRSLKKRYFATNSGLTNAPADFYNFVIYQKDEAKNRWFRYMIALG